MNYKIIDEKSERGENLSQIHRSLVEVTVLLTYVCMLANISTTLKKNVLKAYIIRFFFFFAVGILSMPTCNFSYDYIMTQLEFSGN